jgi:hypothetical protein
MSYNNNVNTPMSFNTRKAKALWRNHGGATLAFCVITIMCLSTLRWLATN